MTNKTNIQIPRTFKQIFEALRTIKGLEARSLIAGGAVRDLYFGQTPRDIDLFIEIKNKNEIAIIVQMLATQLKGYVQIRVKNSKNKQPYYDEAGGHHRILDVVKIEFSDMSAPLEVVFVDLPPKQYFEDFFDLGICKAYYDGTKLHYTSDFFKDVKNKTFTVVGKTTPYLLFRTFNTHIRKLKLRFPDHEIRVDSRRAFGF